MFETLIHLTIPRRSNNFRARLLHSEGVIVLILLVVLVQSAVNFTKVSKIAVLGYAANISTTEVYKLTNEKRLSAGLNELTYSDTLANAAHAKGLDMLEKDYWAHISPDGTEPWSFFLSEGYQYRYAGENLARDFSNPTSAVEAWMASPSHRDNMLSPRYQEMGIAVVEGDLNGVDTTIIVQLFGSPSAGSGIPVAAAQEADEPLAVEEVTALAQVEESTPEEPKANPVAISIPSGSEYTLGSFTISPFIVSRFIALFSVIAMVSVLVIDLVEVHRKKIQRINSRTFAHLSFMVMLLVILLIAKAGQIL